MGRSKEFRAFRGLGPHGLDDGIRISGRRISKGIFNEGSTDVVWIYDMDAPRIMTEIFDEMDLDKCHWHAEGELRKLAALILDHFNSKAERAAEGSSNPPIPLPRPEDVGP